MTIWVFIILWIFAVLLCISFRQIKDLEWNCCPAFLSTVTRLCQMIFCAFVRVCWLKSWKENPSSLLPWPFCWVFSFHYQYGLFGPIADIHISIYIDIYSRYFVFACGCLLCCVSIWLHFLTLLSCITSWNGFLINA